MTAITYGGLFQCKQGEELLYNMEAKYRTSLIMQPWQERGLYWHLKNTLIKVMIDLPLFMLADRSDPRIWYRKMHEYLGNDITPFQGGVAYHAHKDVSEMMTSTIQHKGMYLGAMSVPTKCFGPTTLIFQSTGNDHTRIRDFIRANVKGLSPTDHGRFGFTSPLRPEPKLKKREFWKADEETIKRTVARNLWARIFKEAASPQLEDLFYSYYDAGRKCVLGKTFEKLTLGTYSSRVDNIRRQVFAAANRTAAGRSIWKKAARQGIDADPMLMQLVDDFLFVGLLGTEHLVSATLARIQSNPREYVPLWTKDSEAFLLESARVDPPVASVTAVLANDTSVNVASGRWGGTGVQDVFLTKGSTAQLVISEANVDPRVFGGEGFSKDAARQFNPARQKNQLGKMLSWNGLQPDVKAGTAPRGCPGFHLSFDVARKIIHEALPPEDALAKGRELPAHHGLFTAGSVDRSLRHWYSTHVHLKQYADFFRALVYFLALLRVIFNEKFESERSIRDTFGSFFGYRNDPDLGVGAMSQPFAHWLLAQGMWAFATFLGAHGTADQALIQAGFAFYRCGLVGIQHYSKDFSFSRGGSEWTWTLCSAFYAHFLVALVHLFIGAGEQVPFLQRMIWAYYLPGFLSLWFAMFYFPMDGKNVKDLRRKEWLTWVLIATAASWLWLLVITIFRWNDIHLLVRSVLDTVIVTPLCLPAVRMIDDQCSLRTSSDGKPGGSRRMNRQDDGVHSRIKFWQIASGVLLFLCVAALWPILYEVIRGGQLCFHPDELKHEEVCKKGDGYLLQIDYHSRSLYRVLRNFASNEGQERPIGLDVKVPTDKYKRHTFKQLFFNLSIPEWDEDIHGDKLKSYASTAIFDFLKAGRINPLKDIAVQFESADDAKEIFQVAAGKDLEPLLLTPWDDGMSSDEMISRYAFAGLGAHRMEAVDPSWNPFSDDYNIAFKNDWDWLHDFEVRDGFEHYGAIAYFTRRADLLKIYWSHGHRNVSRGDPDWEHAKWTFKCSVIAGSTLKDHLVGVHFMTANLLATNTAVHLSADHPVRRLLKPHTYGTVTINMGATTTLATEFSLLHRASAFTWDEIERAFNALVSMCPLTDARDQMTQSGMINVPPEIYPFGQDLRDFHRVVSKFVTGYLDVYYPDNNAVLSDKDLTEFWQGLRSVQGLGLDADLSKEELRRTLIAMIISVTGMHNQVGNVADYLIDPRYASPKIRPHREVADVQAAFQGLAIGLMTANLQPKLINNFTHLVLPGEKSKQATALFEDFQTDLRKLAAAIDKRNKVRRFPCNSFNPKYMVSSVSI
jgi:hypothetical protein